MARRRVAGSDAADLVPLLIRFAKTGRFDYSGPASVSDAFATPCRAFHAQDHPLRLDATKSDSVRVLHQACDLLLNVVATLPAHAADDASDRADVWGAFDMSAAFTERNPRVLNARWLLFYAAIELLRTGQWRNLRRCASCGHWLVADDCRRVVCADDRDCTQARHPSVTRMQKSRANKRRNLRLRREARRREYLATLKSTL